MRKFLRKMLLLALMIVPLVTVAQEDIFSCDFENDVDNAAWEYANGTATNQWYIDTAAHNGTGTKGLYISNDNGLHHAYSVGSETDVYAYQTITLTRGTYDISFDWLCGGESCCDYLRAALAPSSEVLSEGISSDDLDRNGVPASWVAIDGGIGLNNSSEWATKTADFYVPADGDYKLVFYWRNDWSSGTGVPAAVDNISITKPSCPAPLNFTVVSKLNDEATLSWIEAGSATSWVVMYEPAEVVEGDVSNVVTETAYDTTITLSGLDYNTEYNVRIIADCSSEYSDTLFGSFRSACGPITLPYSYNFSDVATGDFPQCWYNINNSKVKGATRDGMSTLRFAAGGIIATPHIPLAGNLISLTFNMKREGNMSGDMQIGFATDLADLSTMNVVRTISPSNNDFNEYEIDFSSLGEDVVDEGFIIFKQVNNTSDNWYYWIGDVNIRQISDCKRPASMMARNIKYSSATLSWSPVEGATYEVAYSKVDNPDATEGVTIVSDITDDTLAITDLESETEYFIWVRNNCGGEYSAWRAGGSFTTQEACASLIDVEIMSTTTRGAALSWNYNTSIGKPATAVEVSYRVNGSTDAYVTNVVTTNYYMFNNLESATTYEYSLRTICDMDSAAVVTGIFSTKPCGVTIDGGTQTTSNVPTDIYEDYSYAQMLYPAESLTGLDTIKGVAFNYVSGGGFVRNVDVYIGMVTRDVITTSNYVGMDSLTLVASNASLIIEEGWSTISFDTNIVYDGSSNIAVVVYDHTGTWKPTRSVYYHEGGNSIYKTAYYSMNLTSTLYGLESMTGTPDIIFTSNCAALSCAAPLVALGDVNTSEINVIWAAGGLDNQWVVEYKLESETEWTEYETTTNTSTTITDLLPGSYYEVRIGSICDNDTLYASVGTYTECAAISVPYTEDFSGNALNPCIVTGSRSSSTTLPKLDYNSLYFGYNEAGYAVLPEFSDDLNTLRMTFKMKSYNATAQAAIAIGTDKNDISTFIPIDTVQLTISNTYEDQVVYLNNYEGTGHYIAILAINSGLYFDDIVVETMPLCAMPLHVAISQVTADAAELTWDGDNGLSDNWLIQWRNTTSNEIFEETTTETTFSFSSLASDTEYEVMVSNLCGSDTISALHPVSFRTECGVMVLPFVESFETKPSSAFPSCWTNLGGDNQIVSSASYTTAGLKSLEMDGNATVASPKVPLPGNTIAVDFLLKRSNSDAGRIVVGFATNLNDLSSMEIVDTISPVDNKCTAYELDFSNIESDQEGYIIWKQIERSTDYYVYSSEYYLDNIYIREISSCVRPATASVSGIKHNKAFLSWTAVEGATEYEVVYGTANDVNSSLNISEVVSTDTVTINGLEGDTTYYAWVRNSCGDSYSDWREIGEFTTQVNCAKLINVEVLNTTISGISLSWDFNASVGAPATGVELSWKADADDTYTTIFTDETYYILNGLQSGTSYQIRLRTVCSNDTAAEYTLRVATNDCGTIIDHNSTTTNSNVPSNISWKYSYAQMLYPASDLTNVDTIKTISFYWDESTEDVRTWDVYMANVAQSTLNPSNYINVDSMTLVGSNVPFSTAEGWCMTTLTTPFVYDGTSNLIIAVDDNTGSFPSGGKSFLVHEGSSIYVHSDSQNCNPSSPASFSTTSYVPNLKIGKPCTGDICIAPLLAISEITNNSASLVWGRNDADETWKVDYKLTSAEDWTTVSASTTDTFATISNLQPGSFYEFRVGTICGEEIQYTVVEGFTNCAAVSAPLVENFNAEILNPCWTYGNLQPNNDAPYKLSNMLYMSYDPESYAISPEFIDDLASLHILFSIESYNDASELVVALGTDPSDYSTFVPIDTFTVTETDVLEPKECSFESYTGQGHYVAFYSPTGKMYVDNVTIEALPACGLPSNLAISNVTDQSATITWTGDNRLSSGWLVDYAVVGDNSNIMHQQVAASEYSCTLTGLTANTPYEVIVRNACAEDTIAALTSLVFRTECGAITLPYFENFETVDLGTYHPCWFTSGTHTYGDYYSEESAPEIANVSGYGHVLKFGDNVDMTTQRIPAPMNTLMIKFDAKAESTTYTGDLVLGFVTNSSSTVMTTVIDTIEFSNSNWSTYEYSLTNLTTTDTGYFIFKNINNDSYYNWDWDEEYYYNGYIDNLLISVDNGCEAVTNVRVNNVTQTSVDVAFTDATTSGSYTIGYATTNNSNNITNTVDVADTNYTLTGLQSGTRYYLWVRNNCVAGGSPWSESVTFKTPCSVFSELPYTEDFDSYTIDVATNTSAPSNYPSQDMPNCWNFINMSNSSNNYPQAFMTASTYYVNNGNALLMKSSKTDPLYAVLPSFTTHVSAMQISFKYRNEGVSGSNGKLAVGVMTDVSDPATFTAVKEYPQSSVFVNGDHNFAVDGLDATTDYVIAFRYSGGSSNNYYFAIDEVVIDSASGCPTPESLALIGITENTASLTWNGASASYDVQYRLESASDWTDSTTVTSNSVTLSGLMPQSDYSVRVRSVCGTEKSGWSSVINFSTMCGAYDIPYSEDFNSYTQDIASNTSEPDAYPNHAMPSCWSFPVLNGPKVFLSRHSYYATSGNCLFMTSNSSEDAYAVLPAMNVPIDSLWISFNYRHESTVANNSPLSIGVMTNPTDVTTFRALETYPVVSTSTAAEHSFTIDTGFVDGTTYYIAFRYGHVANYYYLGIDDIVVDYAPTCPKTSAPEVANVTSSTANLTWNSSASNFEVNYKRVADSDWTSVTSTATSYALTNLVPASSYEARVRALCSATDTSEWSASVFFTTECAVVTLPFSENFNNMDGSFDNLHCWERYKGLLSDVLAGTDELDLTSSGWSCYNSSNYPVNNGGGNVFIDIYSTSANYWLVSPSIAITAGAELKFDMARRDYNTEWDSDDKFVVLATNNDGTTWTELRTWTDSTYSNIPLYSASYDSINISLNQYAGQTIKIAFYGESTVSGADHYIHIDNVNVSTTIPTCGLPTNLVSNNITATSAELSWNGNATSYDVEYRAEGDADWTANNITETSYALTNLQPLTNYTWRVRGNCGDAIGNSEWVEATFATLDMPCATPTNVTATVEGNVATIDWTADEDQTSWEVMVYALDTISQVVSAHPAVISNLDGETSYTVKVRAICAENIYSDWSEAITFNTQLCAPVTNVAISDITESAATVTWTAGANETAWQINYGEEGFGQDEGEIIDATATTYTFEGLAARTTYDVYVRALCGDDFYSLWSSKVQFTTLEHQEGIDGVESNINFVIYPNPTSGATTISLQGVEGKVTISIVDMNGRTISSEAIECGVDCEKRIDVAGLAQGTYFVRVLGDNLNSVRKLIVR